MYSKTSDIRNLKLLSAAIVVSCLTLQIVASVMPKTCICNEKFRRVKFLEAYFSSLSFICNIRHIARTLQYISTASKQYISNKKKD